MTDAMEALLRWRSARDRVRRALRELRTAQMDEMLAEREYLDAKHDVPIQQGGPMAEALLTVPKADLKGTEVAGGSIGPSCCTGGK